jgi:hypothetical protein
MLLPVTPTQRHFSRFCTTRRRAKSPSREKVSIEDEKDHDHHTVQMCRHPPHNTRHTTPSTVNRIYCLLPNNKNKLGYCFQR